MVSKAKSIRGSVKSIDYIKNDKEMGDALIIAQNGLAGQTSEQMLDEMRFIQQSNSHCNKNCISIVLSPSDQKQFSNDEFKELALEHLKNLGLDKNQYLATVHTSTGQPHIHIIANRIDTKGVALNDSFIGQRAQDSAEKIAQSRGLLTAREISKHKELEVKPLKKEILQCYTEAKKHSKTFDDFKKQMKTKGVEVLPTINKKGEMQGLRFLHEGTNKSFKASEIHKNVGLADLLRERVKIDVPLSVPLVNIAKEVLVKSVQFISKSQGIGY